MYHVCPIEGGVRNLGKHLHSEKYRKIRFPPQIFNTIQIIKNVPKIFDSQTGLSFDPIYSYVVGCKENEK